MNDFVEQKIKERHGLSKWRSMLSHSMIEDLKIATCVFLGWIEESFVGRIEHVSNVGEMNHPHYVFRESRFRQQMNVVIERRAT